MVPDYDSAPPGGIGQEILCEILFPKRAMGAMLQEKRGPGKRSSPCFEHVHGLPPEARGITVTIASGGIPWKWHPLST